MSTVAICTTDELPVGERIIEEIDGKEIAVFNIDGEYIAVLNYCVHQSGPLCEGVISGTVEADPTEWEYDWEREGKVINCPWHGWEFDLTTGKNLSDPQYEIIRYDVILEDDTILVDIE